MSKPGLPSFTPAAAITRSLRAGRISAVQVVARALRTRGPRNAAEHCFIRRLDKEALADARRLDRAIARGEDMGVLAGVPVAVKDNIAIAGVITTAGSAARADEEAASRDAEVVAGLRSSHAIVLGTTNMNELAYGFTGENPWFGQVPNPWDENRVSGGSSSGSAAAVAAGIVPIALGTDTNGSIRVPAALCGVWGFRPTTGSVPMEGIVPLAQTLDVAGLLTASAADLAAATRVIAAGRQNAATMHRVAGPRARAVVGFPADWASAEVCEAVRRVAQFLEAGDDFRVPRSAAASAAAQILTAVEGADAHRALLRERQTGLGQRTRTRLLAGAILPGQLYLRATALRLRARADLLEAMTDVDVLVAPAAPCPAPSIGAETVEIDGVPEPVNAALGRCTTPFSFVGFPALTVPITDLGPLPVGVQLIAKPGDDALLLDIGCALEAAGIAYTRTS